MQKESILEIENIIRKNLEFRGMDKINLPGEFEGAVRELFSSETVVIITGFVIRDVLVGETDGPLGTLAIASALEQLGKKVVIVTDKYSKELISSSTGILNINPFIEEITHENEVELTNSIISKYRPTHVLAIERPGRALDGNCYSMRGESLTDLVPNTDLIFEEAKKNNIITIAIGDGGNEMGMGKVRDNIINNVVSGDKICSVTTADYLIVAGVSNWGGQALSGALSILSSNMLLHEDKLEVKLLEKIVSLGAVDGCTKKRTHTIDGFSLEENLSVFNKIRNMIDIG